RRTQVRHRAAASGAFHHDHALPDLRTDLVGHAPNASAAPIRPRGGDERESLERRLVLTTQSTASNPVRVVRKGTAIGLLLLGLRGLLLSTPPIASDRGLSG